jgi:hypothetical protein
MNIKKPSKMYLTIALLMFAAFFATSCGSSFLPHTEIEFTAENGITIPGDIYPQDNIQLIASQPPDQSILILGFLATLTLIVWSVMMLAGRFLPR